MRRYGGTPDHIIYGRAVLPGPYGDSVESYGIPQLLHGQLHGPDGRVYRELEEAGTPV